MIFIINLLVDSVFLSSDVETFLIEIVVILYVSDLFVETKMIDYPLDLGFRRVCMAWIPKGSSAFIRRW